MLRIRQNYKLPHIRGMEAEIHPYGNNDCVWLVDPGDVQLLKMLHNYIVATLPDGRNGCPLSWNLHIVEECDE